MISANDRSIIAVICKYHDISDSELELLLSKLAPQAKKLMLAALGRLDRQDLTEEELITVNEIIHWQIETTRRTRDDEIKARRANKETRLAVKMKDLHTRGKISDEVLMLYGISGPLPERRPPQELTEEEKQMLRNRITDRLGIHWTERVEHVPAWLMNPEARTIHSDHSQPVKNNDWITEGF